MEGSGFESYQVIVISMDDLIFNLNHIRFDFAKLLYPNDFEAITYLEFSKTLSTENTIYSFLNDPVKEKKINEKIESFLFSEKNYKNIHINDYIEELLKLLVKQGKKIIVLSTHSHRLAKLLLKKSNLYPYVSQVLGLSEFADSTPSLKLFSALSKYYSIEPSELLLISSMNQLLEIVDGTIIDRMYVGSLENNYLDPNIKLQYSMASFFEVLEFALYGKYTMASPVDEALGFREEMDDEEKADRYSFLQDKFKDSPELLLVVEESYYGSDLLHTTSFDTKEFQLAYEQYQEEKKEKIVDRKDEKKPIKKKRNWLKEIGLDLLVWIVALPIIRLIANLLENHLSGTALEFYHGCYNVFSLFAHRLLSFLQIPYSYQWVENALLVLIIYGVIELLIGSKNEK